MVSYLLETNELRKQNQDDLLIKLFNKHLVKTCAFDLIQLRQA